jgi:hypothetical protein
MVEGGFPHSEIRGSKVVRTSPRLIAAYHVLHRLSVPRHPLNALLTLDRFHRRCPLLQRHDRKKKDQLAHSVRAWSGRAKHLGIATSAHPLRGEAGALKAGQNRFHNDKQQASWTDIHDAKTRTLPPNKICAPPCWWSRTGSNRRHPACKAGALPAELRPQFRGTHDWWAWKDLNFRPHAYQARALTN